MLQAVKIDDIRVSNNHHPFLVDRKPIEIVLGGVRYDLIKQNHIHFVVDIQYNY